jgi:hypothetical protein
MIDDGRVMGAGAAMSLGWRRGRPQAYCNQSGTASSDRGRYHGKYEARAFACGFNDSSHFGRVFAERMMVAEAGAIDQRLQTRAQLPGEREFCPRSESRPTFRRYPQRLAGVRIFNPWCFEIVLYLF